MSYLARKIKHLLKRRKDQTTVTGNMNLVLQGLAKRGFCPTHIMDIGANNGEWSKETHTIYPDARFSLIEPLKECNSSLNKLKETNKNFFIYNVAAGETNEKKTITVWDDLYGSSLRPEKNENLINTGKQREIEVIKIYDLLSKQQIPTPELVKIDVQGYELEALKGFESKLKDVHIIITEVSLYEFNDVPGMPEFFEVVNFMKNNGFVVYDFAGFLRRPLDESLGQCDICFVKEDSPLRQNKSWQ